MAKDHKIKRPPIFVKKQPDGGYYSLSSWNGDRGCISGRYYTGEDAKIIEVLLKYAKR